MESVNNKGLDVIFKDLIFINSLVETKSDAISLIIEKAYELDLIKEVSDVVKSVYKREKEASTAVGLGVAIPHGKTNGITSPLIGFIQLAKSIKWNDEEVNLIFMILIPDNNPNNIHLKFISQLSKNLISEKFREELLNTKDVNSAYKLLKNIEFK